MENTIKKAESETSAESLGKVYVDEQDRILHLTADFCTNFSVDSARLVNQPLNRLIRQKFGTGREIIYGVIQGEGCLLRVVREIDYRIFIVIIRGSEAPREIVNKFLGTLEGLETERHDSYSFSQIIGVSEEMNRLKDLAAKIATSNSTVLLDGESGTGKEVFAQAIHQLSPRKNHSFIAVNCAAIPNELFESELFGYEAGAFSGAKKEGKPGKIELAQKGTLFLDEISELPYESQGKLLRVIQEREVERVGGIKSQKVDIRIITATNQDLSRLVEEGKFRKDLFYRLFVFTLTIPPLRDRKEDILPLADYFVQHFNEMLGREVKFIHKKLQDWLLEYDWPGNIRELKAFIERGMNMADGDTLGMEHIFFARHVTTNILSLNSVQPARTLEEAVTEAEVTAIKAALKEADGDKSLAARKLGIHLASLYRKISKYNIK